MNDVLLSFVRFGDVLVVMGSPDASPTGLRALGRFSPDWDEMARCAASMNALVRGASRDGEFSAAALADVRRLGRFLFDELIPYDAKTWLAGGGEALLLSLSMDLLELPWELLHDGEDFLCVRWSVGRLPQLDSAPRKPTVSGMPSLLVVADPDGTLDEAYNEGWSLRGSMAETEVPLTFRSGDVDPSFVRRHASEHDILHYAGHVDSDGWRMADGHLDDTGIRKMKGANAAPGLVFANGCAASSPDGVLRSWLEIGVRHHLGPLFEVPDRLGLHFANVFYERLLTGLPVGIAVRDARRAVASRVGQGTIPWGSYVLYGDPRVRYVPSMDRERPIPLLKSGGATRLRPLEEVGDPEPTREVMASAVVPPSRTWELSDLGYPLVILAMLLVLALVAWLEANRYSVGFAEESTSESADLSNHNLGE